MKLEIPNKGWFNLKVITTLERCASFADSFVRFESFDEVKAMISVIAYHSEKGC